MDPLRVLVAEDEAQQRARLVRYLETRPDATVVAEAANGRAALDSIRAHRPDLVLLDVQMPEMTGLDVLEALGPDEVPAVVFVTAYAEHAVRAFELHAADYLLKPFDDARLDAVLTRALHRVRLGRVEALSRELMRLLGELKGTPGGLPDAAGEAPPASGTPTGGYLERLGIRVGGKMVLLRTHEIDYVSGAGVYVEVHAGKRRYHLRSTLTALEARLDPAVFVRIHRSTIVNVNGVRELVPHLHGEYVVILEDGTQLKLSRGYRDRLVALMGEMG
jgi:two-component system, LytTR family, response regulator